MAHRCTEGTRIYPTGTPETHKDQVDEGPLVWTMFLQQQRSAGTKPPRYRKLNAPTEYFLTERFTDASLPGLPKDIRSNARASQRQRKKSRKQKVAKVVVVAHKGVI